ncbi:DUF3261 domain-containing protein [Halomonas sp. FME1]|uniref:DUF3261 domain-containing protein n=1 Tax=Halomonas casei TaxID=2742613 RepID=A0ABR9F0Q9_9GAMM|nr:MULTISPECIES: DUF3261 domain-containing protein [Halomonas]MBE0400047.1 DUF3261 domain-containing protein [Halomonas casei]PCC20771.1 hypothetical protein CIK78_00990 [Halomonas sp. JB37]
MTITLFRLTCQTGLLIALFLLLGCAGQPMAGVPSLATLPAMETQRQRLTFEHNNQRHEMIGILRHDEKTLRLVILSPQGQRLLTLIHDDNGSRFQHDAAFEPPFTAEWLASRLSWNLWPAPAIEQTFLSNAWSMQEDETGRTIRYRQRVIARISGNSACALIDDVEADYRLYIMPLSDTDQAAAPCLTP